MNPLSKKKIIILSSLLTVLIIIPLVLYLSVSPYVIKPLTTDEMNLYKNDGHTLVIYPIFTQYAYSKNGFYYHYNGSCNVSCLTVHINSTNIHPIYNTGKFGYLYLHELNYTFVTDVDVDANPAILKKYSTIFLLHNEYVTQKEFDAITSHGHVIFLYPNALYGKIQYDTKAQTITLIRGHNYPDSSIANGFNWKFDNSKQEYDTLCNNWHFYRIDNGFELGCYPDMLIGHDREFLKQLQKD